MIRTGCDHVHFVSHMCRRATHIASLEAAEGKDDKEFVTVVNPAVCSGISNDSKRTVANMIAQHRDLFMLTSPTVVLNKSYISTLETRRQTDLPRSGGASTTSGSRSARR